MDAFSKAVFTGNPPSLVLPSANTATTTQVLPVDMAEQAPPGRMGVDATLRAVAAMVAAAECIVPKPPAARLRILEGLALLWHDHLEAAHEIAQAREGEADFDLLHALLHRREGDFANAGYWFGQAGKHPCYPMIEDRLGLMDPSDLRAAGLASGPWSPKVFLAAVGSHSSRGRAHATSGLAPSNPSSRSNETAAADETARALEHIQAEEFRAFAAYLLRT